MSLASITEWEMYITAQVLHLRNDLCCVEWDVKLYYTITIKTIHHYRNDKPKETEILISFN